MDALESCAPLSLQDGYDNAGMQIGLTEDAETTGALLCLDVTEQVIDEAISLGFNTIVSHHPLLFRGVKTITPSDYISRCITKAIKNDICIYSAHTNLDSAPGGVNYKIADKLDLCDVQWLHSKQGTIGGEGLIGTLKQPLSKQTFINEVKNRFGIKTLRHNNFSKDTIQRVAICGGAGAFLIDDAIRQGADAFLTGEIGYHRFFGHEDDTLLVEMGHYESEQFTIELIEELLNKALPELRTKQTSINTNPTMYS